MCEPGRAAGGQPLADLDEIDIPCGEDRCGYALELAVDMVDLPVIVCVERAYISVDDEVAYSLAGPGLDDVAADNPDLLLGEGKSVREVRDGINLHGVVELGQADRTGALQQLDRIGSDAARCSYEQYECCDMPT